VTVGWSFGMVWSETPWYLVSNFKVGGEASALSVRRLTRSEL